MTSANTSTDIAIIGMGNMGSALAEALLTGGYKVAVWSRTQSRCVPLAERGARVCERASEAAASAGVVVVCLTDHAASLAVLREPDTARALADKLLVQVSTMTAAESEELGHWAHANDICYLDGSILAYPDGVRNGTATIVYSGPKRCFDEHETMLAAMSGKAEFVSETIGGAPTFDKTIYAFHYGSMLAFFHGAAMCHAAGFPIGVYVDEVLGADMATTLHYCECMTARRYDDPTCTIELHATAYAHVLALTESLGVDCALPRLVTGTSERALAEGHGEHELAAVFETLLNGPQEGFKDAMRA